MTLIVTSQEKERINIDTSAIGIDGKIDAARSSGTNRRLFFFLSRFAMSVCLCALRAMSTKIPRPTNWRTSPSDAPQPILASRSLPSRPRSRAPTSIRRPPAHTPTPYEYNQHRLALRRAFPEGWSPPRKISRDAMDSLRMLHNHSPEAFTTPVLAERFKISPEAVRRILKSKWVPSRERKEELKKKDEAKKVDRRRKRVGKEWTEAVDKGLLKHKRTASGSEDQLELT